MTKRTGFTLIELMFAILLSSIVIMAAGGVLVSMQRQQTLYQTHTQLQTDLLLIDTTLRDNVRECYYANIEVVGNDRVNILDDQTVIASFYTRDGSTIGTNRYSELIYDTGNTEFLLSEHITSFDCSTDRRNNGSTLIVRYSVDYPEYNFSSERELECIPRYSYTGKAGNAITDDPQEIWDDSNF